MQKGTSSFSAIILKEKEIYNMKNINNKKFSICSAMALVCLFIIEKVIYGSIDNFECGFATGILAMYAMFKIYKYVETWCKKYLTAIKNAVNEVNNAPKQEENPFLAKIDDCYEYENDKELQQSLEDQIQCLDIEPTPMAMKTEQKEKESGEKKETNVSEPVQKASEATKVEKIDTEVPIFEVSEETETEDFEDSVFDFSAFETNEEEGEEFVFDFSAFETNEEEEKNATKESKNEESATELGEGLEFDNLDDLLHHISA